MIASGFFTIFTFLRYLPSSDLTFSWFASVYSSILVFLAKLFGKRSVLILGGVDVAKIPELKYGIWITPWKAAIVRYGITHADIVLAVDPSIKADAAALAKYNGNNIAVLPTGHDTEYWVPGNTVRHDAVLTVATCDDETRFKIKGIDFLYEIARDLPHRRFILIGMTQAVKSQHIPPANLDVHPPLPHGELLHHYQSAKVYLQPSMREALGSTLCEAMLCGCIPVGSGVGGIPTVIGETGILFPFGDVRSATAAITAAFAKDASDSGRKRIVEQFSLRQRETGLLNIISSIHGT